MFIAVGWFLVKVAIVTMAAVVAAVAVVAGAASDLDSVNNAKDGARKMLGVNNPPARHVLVDDWNDPDGFWQSPNVDENLDYQRTADQWIGAGELAVESIKAAVKAASPVNTIGFDYTEKMLKIREYHADLAKNAPGASDETSDSDSSTSAGSTGTASDGAGNPTGTGTATDESWVCEDGVEWGCDIEVRPGQTQIQEAPSAQVSVQGTYYFNPDASTYLPDWADPASVTEISGAVTIDDDAPLAILGDVEVTWRRQVCGGDSGIECGPGTPQFSTNSMFWRFWWSEAPSGDPPTVDFSVFSGEPGVYREGALYTGVIEGRRMTITSASGSETFVFDRP